MLKQLLGTAGTRVLNALINLIILVLMTNSLGSEGLGIIALIVLDIVIIQLFIDLVAGSAIVYYTSRYSLGSLLFPAYVWIAVIAMLVAGISLLFSSQFPVFYETIVPLGYSKDILLLAIVNAVMLLHYNVLLGQKRINTYNRIFTVQVLSLLTVFVIQVYYFENKDVNAYLNALYMAYSMGALGAVFSTYFQRPSLSVRDWKQAFTHVFRYGMTTQMANILFMGNKRLSVYLIKYFSGLRSLGVYTAGTQLTEGLKLIGQSISMVQFSTISNSTDEEYSRQLTIKLMKFTVLVTAFAMLILMLIPTSVYAAVFSKEFSQMKIVIYVLGPAMISLAITTIYSAYFSGKGKPEVNLRSNLIGIVFTAIFAISLIPVWGYVGAAITAFISFTASSCYQYIIFRKQTHTKASEWLIRKSDFSDFLTITKNIWQQDK